MANAIFGKTTIAGAVKRTTPEELCWGAKDSYFCEYPRASVQSEPADRDAGCTEARMKAYLRVIKCLRQVSAAGNKIPGAALQAVSRANAATLVTEIAKSAGHYIFPQSSMVRAAMRRGVKLILRHADHVFSSYVAVVEQSIRKNINPRKFATPQTVLKLIDSRTRAFGVACWSLTRHLSKGGPGARKRNNRPSKATFFSRMRSNEGLVELTQIVMGACLCVVGVISARRQGELMDLVGDDCVDAKNEMLVFKNRKTGLNGVQDFAARPLHPLAVRIIRRIQKFHTELGRCGASGNITGVFSTPTYDGVCVLSHASMNRLLDRFVDYIELPVTKDGTRAYLRQHQLRRYFATNFYKKRAGTIDALTWYMGHMNERQVESYIDAEFYQEERTRMQAHAAVECLLESDKTAYEILRDVIERKFGIRKFEIEQADAVEQYLSEVRNDAEFRLVQETLLFPGKGQLVVSAVTER